MDPIQSWTLGIVIATFALYIVIAIWSRAASTADFFTASKNVSPLANGMATAADWMSAASFISMAGIISFSGRDGAMYLMGWTGGYVLLALLLAPYLRKFGKFTVPDFVGDRYYSGTARVVAVICAIFVSFTYVCGQMQGVGIVFTRFLELPEQWMGIVIGMFIVFFYAVLGGMKGITYTQVAQYCVLIFAFMVPAIFISFQITGNPIPQLGFGGDFKDSGVSLLSKLDGISEELGFGTYTAGHMSTRNMFFITAALMLGTAGLPHVIVRFYTVKHVKDARTSAFWALLFIAILYTAAPAVAVFARTNLLVELKDRPYAEVPAWFNSWENTSMIAWVDKNDDGKIQYNGSGPALKDKNPVFAPIEKRGSHGQRVLLSKPSENTNELYVHKDIMVLANPEIAELPNWVIGLVAAGGLAAALSTAAGLLLVISSALAHDLVKKTFKPDLSDRHELGLARIGAGFAVIVAGYFGMNPPGFVAEVVAFAFGLAAASFFPAIIMGIFSSRMNKYGAVSGMIVGIVFTATYIIWFKIWHPELNAEENWWFGIKPEGIGTLGMMLNFIVAVVVSSLTPAPPAEVQTMVRDIRLPEESEYEEFDPSV